MKKVLIALLIIVIVGGVGWFVLLRPEQVSNETLKQDFAAHEKDYESVGTYLLKRKITTEITDIAIADKPQEGIVYEDSDEYKAFMDGWYNLMQENHTAIRSDGTQVEFVYESTGGLLNRKYGAIIYNGKNEVDGKTTVYLQKKGWHMYVTKP